MIFQARWRQITELMWFSWRKKANGWTSSQKVCDMLLAEDQQMAKLPNERVARCFGNLLTLGLNTDVQTTTPDISAHATESALSVAKNSPGRTTVEFRSQPISLETEYRHDSVFGLLKNKVGVKCREVRKAFGSRDRTYNYGGFNNANPASRQSYTLIHPCAVQNPFYCALPYNDVIRLGQTKPEAALVIPWFRKTFVAPGLTVCKSHWVAIRKGKRIAYAQWEDSGPFRTDHFQYVLATMLKMHKCLTCGGLECLSGCSGLSLDWPPLTKRIWQSVEVRRCARRPVAKLR